MILFLDVKLPNQILLQVYIYPKNPALTLMVQDHPVRYRNVFGNNT